MRRIICLPSDRFFRNHPIRVHFCL